MQIGLGGNLSGGKTVTMVMLACQFAKEKKKRIIANFDIKLKEATYVGNSDLVNFIIEQLDKEPKDAQANFIEKFGNTVLCIDEINNLLNARKATSNLNNQVLQALMMLGKLSCDLLYSFQVYESQVDKELRLITPITINCEKRDLKTGKVLLFADRIVDKPIFIKCNVEIVDGKRIRKGTFCYDPAPYYRLYDTTEIVLLDRDKYRR